MLTQPIGEPDAAPYILGMLGTDHRIRVQRVAIAVQACDLNARAFELSKEIITRGVGGEDVVEGGNVHRR